MDSAYLENETLEILREILKELDYSFHYNKIDPKTSFRDIGIDSLTTAELFQRIEKKLKIQIPSSIIAEADSVRALVQAINNNPVLQTIQPPPQNYRAEYNNKGHFAVPELAKTLTEVLCYYAETSPEKIHIDIDNDDKNELITYGELFNKARIVAQNLLDEGLSPGDRVAIMLPTCSEFFYTFLGIQLAKCIPVPIYPPFKLDKIESYINKEAKILQNAGIKLLVTFEKAKLFAKIFYGLVPSLNKVVTAKMLIEGNKTASLLSYQESDLALIQYTSGSTSDPKGVSLTHANLIANIRAYGSAINVSSSDIVVSWLPLYHDLGLIGNWLGSLYYGTPLRIFSPLQFLNSPQRWLWSIHHTKATIISAPNFAYEMCANKLDDSLLEGLDISSIRLAINGAEPVHPTTLKRFADKFSRYGFKSQSFLPVYGLAESALGLTASPLNRGPLIDSVDRKMFETEQRAIPSTSDDKIEFVSCGLPLPNHEIRFVDKNNNPVAERVVGKLQFKGPSTMQGYYNNPEATKAAFFEDWLNSGDNGYKVGAEIFITGRDKDVLIKAGRNIYPSDIERAVSEINKIRRGCVIAFSTLDSKLGTEKIIIAAETNVGKNLWTDLKNEIRQKISATMHIQPDEVILLPPHSIPKTSSGKLQRQNCKMAYLAGNLGKKPASVIKQAISLTSHVLKKNSYNIMKYVAKLFYSIYIACISAATLVPILLILFMLPSDKARSLIKGWTILIKNLSFLPITITGKQHIDESKPTMYVANHTSYLDIVLLISNLPANTLFLCKKELLKVPVLSYLIRKVECIAVDRHNIAEGLECTQNIINHLKNGYSMFIFPEGTFRERPGLSPFKLGAFKIAASINIPVCPIAIRGLREVLPDTRILMQYSPVNITILPNIKAEDSSWESILKFSSSVRNEIAKFCGEAMLDFTPSNASSFYANFPPSMAID